MARPLLNLSNPIKDLQFQAKHIMAFFFALMAMCSLISIVSFLCVSHTRKKSHTKIEEETSTASSTCQSDKKLLKKLNSSISSKTHHLMEKMNSWRKIRDEGDEDEDEDEHYKDEAIWRRTIIMGERCRPLEFSEEILYDCDGNLLPNESFRRKQSSIST